MDEYARGTQRSGLWAEGGAEVMEFLPPNFTGESFLSVYASDSLPLIFS